jgi:hypothetical protein
MVHVVLLIAVAFTAIDGVCLLVEVVLSGEQLAAGMIRQARFPNQAGALP